MAGAKGALFHCPSPGFSLDRAGGGRSGGQAINFDTFISRIYLPHIKQRKRSWTVDERIARRYLSSAFGGRPLTVLSRGEVENWLAGLAAQGLAPATLNRVLAVFKSVCSLAAIYGVFPTGPLPCAGICPFKIYNLRERRLSAEQSRHLMRALAASARPEARVLQLLLLTGARKSEILQARWEHVHLERHLLTVPLSKSGRPRQIALSSEAATLIASLERRAGSPWLFPGRRPDKPLSDVYLFWNRLRQELGFEDLRVHDLRHTFASLLVNGGRSLYEVQKLLGHSDPRTTMRYAHLGASTLLAAAQTVSSCLLEPGEALNPF